MISYVIPRDLVSAKATQSDLDLERIVPSRSKPDTHCRKLIVVSTSAENPGLDTDLAVTAIAASHENDRQQPLQRASSMSEATV